MTSNHWAIFALRDIQTSLDTVRYDVAGHHIEDAIHAIIARDAQCDSICNGKTSVVHDSLER
ncbi:hypothetical protein [Roseobacter sp.]|uniref:hypothetical protein n=1 Tax=Roseobacter sp. TaxID=1907202 RepID=UPI00385E31ED